LSPLTELHKIDSIKPSNLHSIVDVSGYGAVQIKKENGLNLSDLRLVSRVVGLTARCCLPFNSNKVNFRTKVGGKGKFQRAAGPIPEKAIFYQPQKGGKND
jgi:hypothetical protein